MPPSPSPCFFTASSAPAARLLLLLHPPSTILGSAASSFLQLEKRGFCGTRTATAGMAGSGEEKKAPAGGVSERIMPHLLNIYGSCATARDFEIYAPNATFEDPLMRAHGVKQIKSAFYTLPKVFGESKIAEYTVEENPTGPGETEVLIDNRQVYKVAGRTVEVASLIRLDVDQDGKVVKHEDWWDKKPLKTRDTVAFPLAGRVAEATRRGAMLLTHALMGFGKDPDTSSSSTS